MRVVPPGLAHLFHFTRHFRAGLSYLAATRLQTWCCLFRRLHSTVALTQSREAAPFQNGFTNCIFPQVVKPCAIWNRLHDLLFSSTR
jgi:hypothetical protein